MSPRDPGLRLLILLAFSAASTVARAEDSATQDVTIHVVGNGWHAGLVLPAAAINAQVPGLRERFPQAQQYEIGWGDLGFYKAQQITAGLAFEALFASKGSLLHVVSVPGAVNTFFLNSDVAQMCVSRAQYEHMARLIAQTFVVDGDGQPISVGPGLYGDSQFYKAHGTYSVLNTCNRWTATVLQAGGLPINPRFRLTAGSVLDAVRTKGAPCRTAFANPG